MNLALWILQIVLAAVFLGAGVMKLARPKEALAAQPGWGYVAERTAAEMKAIGAAEVAGALGLVLPWAIGILPVLTPLAALGLAVLMAGAIATHRRRGEPVGLPATLGLLSLLVALGRSGILG